MVISFAILFIFASLSFVNLPAKKEGSSRVKYEMPEIKDSSSLIHHLAYSLSYKEIFEQAEWVAYLLTKEMDGGESERENNFRADTLVKTGSAIPADYYKSGFDKGHLAPAADMAFSKKSMSESFLMSNMSPQRPQFNRGIWKKLEEQVRKFAEENDSVYVATGPVLTEGLPAIGKNKVAIPQYFYKVIVVYKQNHKKGIAFVLQNKASKEKLESFAVPIDSVEELTGINFFSLIPVEEQNKIEAYCQLEDWFK